MNKKIIQTKLAPAAIGPYSQGVLIESTKTLYMSGQIGLVPGTNNLISDVLEDQVKQVFENIREIVKEAGGDLNNIVKLTLFMVDLKDFSIVNEIMKSFFDQPFPARSTVEISELPKGALFEAEAIAVF
ncbi:putative translation-inhibition endoribonuclease [Taylorella equigenitalis 14/56]|uniref:Putative translation-inhibition endoribonuclease n=1 Tax=Taylorella equigenitalis 14/56 TaxID=1091497 RepID=I7IIL8_9BURK|nr:Rid family detoxifying hydrolase [Taylorella equigenitalis]CCG17562.1 putative translation-inhibition endoribonuclease [Taylorella equigenitalis 14/56]